MNTNMETIESILSQYDPTHEYPCSPLTKSTGFTKLMFLIIRVKKIDMIKLHFENHELEINKQNDKGWTALHIVCRNANDYDLEVARWLLLNGANVNLCNNEGFSPLLMSCRHSNKGSNNETVKLLLECGANVDLCENNGWNPLLASCRNSNIDSNNETVKLLLNYGANVDLCENNGWSPLLLSCKYSNTDSNNETVRLLLEHGANVNLCDKSGSTPLLSSCEFSKTESNNETIKLLLEHGANIDIGNVEGPSHLVLFCKHFDQARDADVVKLLLMHGADLTDRKLWIVEHDESLFRLLLEYCPGNKLMHVYDITTNANVKLMVLKHLGYHYHAKICKNNMLKQLPKHANIHNHNPDSLRIQLMLIYKDKHPISTIPKYILDYLNTDNQESFEYKLQSLFYNTTY